MTSYMNEDAVMACVDLVERCGANGFTLGYVHEGVPVEEAGWYAQAEYHGARIMTDEHRSPTTAAMALSERLLAGATCRCRRPVTLSGDAEGCRWRLMGPRWEPGCDAAPLSIAKRGDVAAIQRALAEVPQPSRAERRGRAWKSGKGRWKRG